MDDTTAVTQFRAWDDELARHDRVDIRSSRRRLVLLTLVCAAFAAIGALLAASSTGGDLVMAWACLVFFGLGAVVLARQALRREPAVAITSREVGSPVQGWSVPWSSVRGAFVFSTRGNHLVTVVVDAAWYAAWLRDAGRVRATLARANRRFLGAEAMSLPGQLDADAELLAAWIDSRGTGAGRPPTAG